ncbi:MAG: hypothetical protein P9M15_08190 [Candidatus Electryoneaceae bacterium]|nr:hypothetical protein [Candidatus Electryoneaceae bacterium]
MKCPHCNTLVVKIPVTWKCPHCGELLPEPGRWFRFVEGMTIYLQDRGAIFWGITFAVIQIMIGAVEMFYGHAYMFSFFGNNMLMSLASVILAGMLIDMYVKIILPLHLPYGSDFILKERKVIRNVRKWTHWAVIAGIVSCLIWIGPSLFFVWTDTSVQVHAIPVYLAYLVVVSWFLGLAWSVTGLFLNPKWLEDVRFRHFLDYRLGIISLKKYRKIGTVFIAVLVLTMILYFILLQIPGIWDSIQNTAFIGSVILFLKLYFSWLF